VDELARETGIPVILERDAVLALMGEYAAGGCRGAKSVLGFFFGTGVGASYLEKSVSHWWFSGPRLGGKACFTAHRSSKQKEIDSGCSVRRFSRYKYLSRCRLKYAACLAAIGLSRR
jgi:hypothetical protein